MEDQEISCAGFELDEFYEDEALEDEADYEPEDDYERRTYDTVAPAGTLLCSPPQLRAAHRGSARRKGLLPLRLLHRRLRL